MARLSLRGSKRSAGSSGPHRFVEPDDPRSGLALGAAQASLQIGPAIALADASLRAVRCALPGCGKPRPDPIHEVAD
jgi:hypothetical protein